MLGLDARAARSAWTVLLVALGVVVAYYIRRTILVFIAALLLAYLLSPAVSLIDRATPKRFPRVLSLTAVYLLIIALIGFGGAAAGSRIIQEASQLAASVPQWFQSEDPLSMVPVPPALAGWKASASQAIRAQLESNVKAILPFVGHAGEWVFSLLTNLAFVVVVPILSFFFLKDGASIRQAILKQFLEGPQRTVLEDLLSDIHLLLGQFMRALVILSCVTLVFYGFFFISIGLPYAALLAGLAGALEFIPVVGPLSASVVILLVAILSGHANLAIWILLFLVLFRLFQDYVLQPYLMGAGVELHPLWVIFGVLAGQQIAGAAGMFLSVPALATLRLIYIRTVKQRRSHPPQQTRPC